jgi:hypothetical protein
MTINQLRPSFASEAAATCPPWAGHGLYYKRGGKASLEGSRRLKYKYFMRALRRRRGSTFRIRTLVRHEGFGHETFFYKIKKNTAQREARA